MAAKPEVFDIDLGGFSSSESDSEAEEKGYGRRPKKQAKTVPTSSTNAAKPKNTKPASRTSSRSVSKDIGSGGDSAEHSRSSTSDSQRSHGSSVSSSFGVSSRSYGSSAQSNLVGSLSGALGAYYGSGGPTRAESIEPTSTDEKRFDFKSKYFSVENFTTRQISEYTVPELVEFSDSLSREVTALDSEMQMMVYDNYNKFISATDTIREMKGQVENMEKEMNRLLDNMQGIQTASTALESKFQDNRLEIDKLVGVRRLLKRLEFLFELPHRLRANIKLGSYQQAVDYFKMATNILQRYSGIKSFKDISTESMEIMEGLRQDLKYQMIQSTTPAARQLEIAGLLLQLDEPAEHLWYDILRTRKDALLGRIIKLKDAEELKKYYEQVARLDAQNTFHNTVKTSYSVQAASSGSIKANAKPAEQPPKPSANEQDDTNPFKISTTDPFSDDTTPVKEISPPKEEPQDDEKTSSNPFHEEKTDEQPSNNPFHESDTNVTNVSPSKLAVEKPLYFSVIEFFRAQFLSVFLDFVEGYTKVFVTPFQPKVDTSHRSHRRRHHHGSRRSHKSRQSSSKRSKGGRGEVLDIDDDANNEAATQKATLEKSIAALSSFTRDVFTEYFTVIKACLQKETDIDKLTDELQSFYDGLYKPSELTPNAKLRDRGTEIIETCIRTSMRREFERTQQFEMDFIVYYLRTEVAIDALSPASVSQHVNTCIAQLNQYIKRCLDRLVPLTTSQSTLIPVLELNFDNQLWMYTSNLLQYMGSAIVPFEFRTQQEAMHTPSEQTDTFELKDIDLSTLQPIKLLVLAKIFAGIESNVIPQTLTQFRKNFLYAQRSMGLYKQEVMRLQKDCAECASGLRLMFAQRSVEHLMTLIYENEVMSVAEDEQPSSRPFLQNVLQTLSTILNNLSSMYDTPENMRQYRESGTRSQVSAHTRGIERFFSDRPSIYDTVKDSPKSILFSVYKILLKYWSEILRFQRISLHHFGCIQSDMDVIRSKIPRMIVHDDFSSLEAMIDDIQVSAEKRCVEATARNADAEDNQLNFEADMVLID